MWSCLRTGGALQVGSESVEKLRLIEGVPAYGIDIVEKDLPQETSQTRALHFNKGCYLGQEIVERIHSRGNVHRHLRPLELTGAVPENGTELKLENGTSVGHITSATEVDLPKGKRIFALGMVKSEAESGNQALGYFVNSASGTARILEGPPKL